MRSYGTYVSLTLVVPISLLLTIAFISIFVMFDMLNCGILKKCKNLSNIFKDIVIRVNKFLVIEFEERKENVTEELKDNGNDETTEIIQHRRGTNKYFLYGVEVRYRVIRTLCVVFLTVFGMSFVLFWNTFIADEIIGCDSEWDCFVSGGNISSYEPINNCTQYDKYDENITIICFRIALKFSEGVGDAGGFLFAMQVLVNFLIYITVRLGSFKGSNRCTLLGGYLCMIFGLTIVIVFVPWVLFVSVPEIIETFRTPQRLLQFIIYTCMNIVTIMIFPPILLQGIKN